MLAVPGARRRLTQERIVDALIALISDEHPFEVSMADVAWRGGISEPTLHRHFPTKRDLSEALATAHYRHLTEASRQSHAPNVRALPA